MGVQTRVNAKRDNKPPTSLAVPEVMLAIFKNKNLLLSNSPVPFYCKSEKKLLIKLL